MKVLIGKKRATAIFVAIVLGGCSGSGSPSSPVNSASPSPEPVPARSASPVPTATSSPPPSQPPPTPSPTPTAAPVVMGDVTCTIPQPPGTFAVFSTSGTYTATGSFASATNTTGAYRILNSTYSVFMTNPSPSPSPASSPTPTPGPTQTPGPSQPIISPSAAPMPQKQFAGTYALPAFSGTSATTADPFSTAPTTGCFVLDTYAEPIYGSPDNAAGYSDYSTNSFDVTKIASGSLSVQMSNITPVGGSGTMTLDNGVSGTITITGSSDYTSAARRPGIPMNSMVRDSAVWYRTRGSSTPALRSARVPDATSR